MASEPGWSQIPNPWFNLLCGVVLYFLTDLNWKGAVILVVIMAMVWLELRRKERSEVKG